MRITNIKPYTTKHNIYFRDNRTPMDNSSAELMLQTPNAALNFAKDRYIANKADSTDSNMLTSLGYKLYRTFGILTNHETPKHSKENNFSAVA